MRQYAKIFYGGDIMEDYMLISGEEDIELFLEKTNHLHDGYVISTSYKNDGVEMTEGGYDFYFDKSHLTLQILVTSLQDTIVELVFDRVYEWRLCGGEREILDSYISFDVNGGVIFTDEEYDGLEPCGDIFVSAAKMSWRIIEL